MKMEYEKITDAGQFRKQELTGFFLFYLLWSRECGWSFTDGIWNRR